MTHTAACELADRFASAAPFHGARHIGFDCVPEDGITMPLFEVWYVMLYSHHQQHHRLYVCTILKGNG